MSNQGSHWDGCWKEHQQCAWAEVERLRADLAAARADAERYRWLRKTNAYHLLSIAWIIPAAQKVGADCDKAIDAAIAGDKK